MRFRPLSLALPYEGGGDGKKGDIRIEKIGPCGSAPFPRFLSPARS